MIKNLVIWDFDGVIADSERIWIKNRQEELNKRYNLNWDFETTNNYLGGMSDKTKREVLDSMGIFTDDDFWKTSLKKDILCIKQKKMLAIPDVEYVLKKINKQCLATGGVLDKTIKKLKSIDFWNKYFNEKNVFTVDMVKNGKPNPDLFLYAADKMNEKTENCVVIEDSLVGMKAAQNANIDVIAFLGSSIYQNEIYISKVKNLGVKNIFYDMKSLGDFLLK